MKKYFKKAATILGSALMIGSTIALAAAATYPAPFVSAGTADVALVIGANAPGSIDSIAATNIGAALGGSGIVSSTSTTDTTSGETISLDTSSQRIYLNTSINAAKTTLTKTDLPIVLAEGTFSGNVDAKITHTLKFMAGVATGKANSGKVIFAKQPKSSSEPVIGLSMGAEATPLYNATLTFGKEVALNHSDSEGETLTLFGRPFTISTATDGDTLVLFSSSEEVTLVAGGSSPNPSTTVTVSGETYTIELVSGSDTTATISVNGESKEINEGSSKKIAGLEVAIKTVDESTAINTITANILLGSEKITLESGSKVTVGSDADPVDGTEVYFTGSDTAQPVGTLSEITIGVYRTSSSNDVVLPGDVFTDPVFGGFKVDFVGMSSETDGADRDEIKLDPSTTSVDLEMTDSDGNTKSFTIAYNETADNAPYNFNLSDGSGKRIHVREMANVSEEEYIVLGNEDYGHLIQITQIYNNTGSSYSDDKLSVQDVLSSETHTVTFTAEGKGTLTLDGKQYTVLFRGDGDTGWATFKYPTGDSDDANTMVLYPTIQTKSGAKIALIEPVFVDVGKFDGGLTGATTAQSLNHSLGTISLPDGDGYSDITIALNTEMTVTDGHSDHINFTSGSDTFTLNTSRSNAADDHVINITIGDISYYFKSVTNHTNNTEIGILNISADRDKNANTALLNYQLAYGISRTPGVLIWEEKDDGNDYEIIYAQLELGGDTLGVNDLFWSSPTYYSETSVENNKIEQEIDYWGTYAETDSTDADKKSVVIRYPDTQMYAKLYIGETTSVVTPGAGSVAVGGVNVVPVFDSEVSSVSTNNLIVVGGSCINTVAAKLLGSDTPVCSADFTALTDVASGQYLIQTFTSPYSSDKVAMLVAGYNAADTTKAATYLKNNAIDTTKKYVGSTATEATASIVSE